MKTTLPLFALFTILRKKLFEEMSDSEFFILVSPNLSLTFVIPRHSNVGKLSLIGSRNLPGLVFE